MSRYFILFAGLCMLVACHSQRKTGNKETDGIDNFTFEKNKVIQGLPAERFNRVLDSLNPIVIDVRQPDKYAQKHIKNAINLDYENLNFTLELSRLDKNKPYAVYCDNGLRSKLALQKFIDADIKTVFLLKGGLEAFSKYSDKIEQQ